MLLLAACASSVIDANPGGGSSGVEQAPGNTSTDSGASDGWSPPQYDPGDLPAAVPTLEIEIDAAAMDRLDADPYHAPDERGVFIDADGNRHQVDLSYRGAYQLQNVMSYYDLRNWKVKFADDDRYLGMREWNFNYEPHFHQELAHDLFRLAGVAVPSSQHVVLRLNGVYQGTYLQYQDPDNKSWLYEQFGSDEGDLYKAAYDLPGETQCFADLTVLGDSDADYACHYTKKTNDEVDPSDVVVLRAFVDGLNDTADEAVVDWFEASVDIDRLLSYLVVSNFIANWDSYPQRPKNYWLYEDRRAGRMVFVPWDLDGTFDSSLDTYNQMGTTASVLFELLQDDYTAPNDGEGDERPLVRRLLADEATRVAYLERYRALNDSLLSEDYLLERLGALDRLVQAAASNTDRQRIESETGATREFIVARARNVQAELAAME